MEAFSTLLVLCAGNSPVNSPHQEPVMQSVDGSAMLAKANSKINRRVAGDLRRYDAECDVIEMTL